MTRFEGFTCHLLKGLVELGEFPVEGLEDCSHAVAVLFEDAVGDHHLQVLAQHEKNVLHSKLAHRQTALLVDDPEVCLDPLWSQVLDSNGLQLEGVLLEVFKPNLKENFIGCINFFNSILRTNYILVLIDALKQQLVDK